MSIAVAVFTDGRWNCLAETIASAGENLSGPISRTFLVVDGDQDAGPIAESVVALGEAFPGAPVFTARHRERLGFGGTIARAWERLAGGPEQFVFHLEDDFTFRRPVDLNAMAEVLAHVPHLAQLALRRQPWNDAERAAGGIVEQWPDEYLEREYLGFSDCRWLEHRLCFTTNPSLYRRELCAVGWPTEDHSEGVFTHRLLADGLPWGIAPEDVRFGYWGARDSGEWVHHEGDHRVGTGY